ncbi:unnamed protein product [Spirodela intermedia]|uniref:Protein TIFY n=1 Tax=Spirodela intermedia TaxID=51605 RepID=A0A7I8IMK7_SPIIN|nr:unnamed protein product [Spirodela intermedia]CAA6658689.1 unnamed protein product [Spirodela intermedia]
MVSKAEMGERRAAEKASTFSVTCSRLRRLSAAAGDRSAAAAATAAPPIGGIEKFKPEALQTMNLMPGVEVSGEDDERKGHTPSMDVIPSPAAPEDQKGQMTIFYAGRVVVFDNFPAGSCPAATQRVRVEAPAPVLPRPNIGPSPASTSEAAAATAAPVAAQEAPQKPPQAAGSDLPIARRVSLHRFLEKRKDRIISKAPYPVSGSSAAGKPEDGGKWLGLAAPPVPPSGELRLQGSSASGRVSGSTRTGIGEVWLCGIFCNRGECEERSSG